MRREGYTPDYVGDQSKPPQGGTGVVKAGCRCVRPEVLEAVRYAVAALPLLASETADREPVHPRTPSVEKAAEIIQRETKAIYQAIDTLREAFPQAFTEEPDDE